MAYCSSYNGSSNRPAIELADRLAEICYPQINNFYFTSGGGESTDSNFKLARSYWKAKGKPDKTKVIARTWGYHGVTFAAMCATGISGYWTSFEPRMPGFSHIPAPTLTITRCPKTVARRVLRRPTSWSRKSCARVPIPWRCLSPSRCREPVVLSCHRMTTSRVYREICDQYDVLFVADEVITGFGRTGKLFALDHYGVQPDLMQFAKSITSGYLPLGGIGISDEVAATIRGSDKPWMHAYTYSGHPTTCAVGLATLDFIEKENLVEQAATKGAYLLDRLHAELDGHPHVGNVRGKGMMCGVELVEDKATKAWYPAEWGVGGKMTAALIANKIFTRMRSEVVCIAPALTTDEATIDELVAGVRNAIVTVFGE